MKVQLLMQLSIDEFVNFMNFMNVSGITDLVCRKLGKYRGERYNCRILLVDDSPPIWVLFIKDEKIRYIIC